MKIILTFLSAILIFCSFSRDLKAELPSKIVLAATDWCPYTCSTPEEHPGVIGEYVAAILKKHGIHLEIQFLPWSRAIAMANEGEKVHGLLTAVHEEAPELLLTDIPIMTYNVCFFTNTNIDWEYKDITSLSDIPEKLGVIRDYGYGSPVDEHIKNPKNEDGIHFISGSNALQRLILMLEKGRIDLLLDDKYVIRRLAKKNNINDSILRNAGCLPGNPFYLAINPKFEWSQELIDLFNDAFSRAENQEVLKSMFERQF